MPIGWTVLQRILICALTMASGAAPALAESVVGEDLIEGLALSRCRAVEIRQITGFTRASRRVVISAESTGRLLLLSGVEGRALGGASVDEASVLVARVDSETLKLELAAEKIALRQAEASLSYYQREEERMQRLGELASDEARLARRHAAELADIAVAAVRSRIALAEDRLWRSEIHAEPGLIVLRRLVEPGSYVTPGTPLLELGDYRTLEVEMTLGEDEIAALRTQARVDLHLMNYPGFDEKEPIKVESLRVFPEFDETSRKRRVELEVSSDHLPEASGGLRVVLRVEIPDASGAYAIPASFIQNRYDEYFVQTNDGAQRVTIVRRNADQVIVMGEGLNDDLVIRETR